MVRSYPAFTSIVLHLHFMLDQNAVTFVCRRGVQNMNLDPNCVSHTRHQCISDFTKADGLPRLDQGTCLSIPVPTMAHN